MKRCIWCGRDLPESEFYRDARYADGLLSGCKACRIAKAAKAQAARYVPHPRTPIRDCDPMTPRERWEAMFA